MFNIGDEVCIKKGKTISHGAGQFQDWLKKHQGAGTTFIVEGFRPWVRGNYHELEGTDYIIHVDDLVKPILTLENV